MRLIDLSVPVATGMPVYPGDPRVAIAPALSAAADGVNVLHLDMGSQSGTHVDAPFHIDDTLPTLDELPLERFWGRAVVVDARGAEPRTPLGPSLFEGCLSEGRPRAGDIVLVATGWSRHWGGDDYLAHPYLTREAAELLVAAGIRTVGIDALSVDPTPADDFPAHRILCGAHAVIAENLTGLDPLLDAQTAGEPIEVSLLPLRLPAADGAPVRAVARVG
ncbi:cyclase family protein [Streptomyces violaceusniger]|uniref:Cyclase family protein n=1 Tax=Streptomyces violaceusniger (strain Tu 4113) TaxID=653045 RepID=G2P5G7_STRV4|nr:cyclase family protein [Streptomyces violaceusniger]AEM84780.1 cyclase family protein [Streptomyces violaceusniger Tu 4113]